MRLEDQLQGELKFARILCVGDRSKCRGAVNSIWQIEIWAIQDIKNVKAELHFDRFAQGFLFLQRSIQIDKSGPNHIITRGVAESESSGRRERGRIEPLRGSFRPVTKVSIDMIDSARTVEGLPDDASPAG